MKIPVSVVIVTRNAAADLPGAIESCRDFAEIVVVDSASRDGTPELAKDLGARVEPFVWNGRYPKKRQWCLDCLNLVSEWIFFVDADERLTPELVDEIRDLFFRDGGPACDGYFVDGVYVWAGRRLRFGLRNSKLALFRRGAFVFPEIDDLDFPGMGEIEGHYQPVPAGKALSGRLRAALLHDACADRAAWEARHLRYARWEAAMIARGAYPPDPRPVVEFLKRAFRRGLWPVRAAVAFLHSYFWRLGFLDGRAGLDFALSRAAYYRMVGNARTARG